MNNTKDKFESYRKFWDFIEEHLPNYYQRDDVMQSDILLSFLTNDDMSDDDMEWIENEFHSDKSLVKEELLRLEAKFAEEALESFFDKI